MHKFLELLKIISHYLTEILSRIRSFICAKFDFFQTFTEPPDCFQGCQATPTNVQRINPSPTILPTEIIKENENNGGENEEEEDFFEADRQFWIVTVLKSDGKDPVLTDLKNNLAKLYKMAFQRYANNKLGAFIK